MILLSCSKIPSLRQFLFVCCSSNPLEEKETENKPKEGKPKKDNPQAGEKRKAGHALDEIMKVINVAY